MNKDKHFYIIVGLLVVVVVLLVMLLKAENKSVADLVEKASSNISVCSDSIGAWQKKYPKGTPLSVSANDELDVILKDCSSRISRP